mgnify:CR=1 FL=1|tara:strand:+ start:4130 stop:4927 length:798 start_codon:yes stop_codon:yes gene_type:complete
MALSDSEKLCSELVLSGKEKDWISAAYRLEGGQSKYQNQNFVVGSQITPYKKVQQALLELQMRDNTRVEVEYSLKKNNIARKKLERELRDTDDPLDRELLELEIEKSDYDRSLFAEKLKHVQREMSVFIDELEETVDPNLGLEYYLDTNEEEDKKYWQSRMAKQAACDIIAFGHIGTGNMDSIMNLPEQDQVNIFSGAVHHSALIGAGVKRMQHQMEGQVQGLLQGEKFSPPQINGSELLNAEAPTLPEVKHDIPKEKIRLQSSN